MQKAQSYITQFIIFFVAGFILFLSIGSFYKMQSDYFIGELSFKNARIFGSYISSLSINLIDSCKQCDYSKVRINLEPTYNFMLKAKTPKNLEVVLPQGESYSFSIHNLNSSLTFEGSSSFAKTITLTFNKNKLMVE